METIILEQKSKIIIKHNTLKKVTLKNKFKKNFAQHISLYTSLSTSFHIYSFGKSLSHLFSWVPNLLYSAHCPHWSTGEVPATFGLPRLVLCPVITFLFSITSSFCDSWWLWSHSVIENSLTCRDLFRVLPFSLSFYLVFCGCATCIFKHQNVGGSQGFALNIFFYHYKLFWLISPSSMCCYHLPLFKNILVP